MNPTPPVARQGIVTPTDRVTVRVDGLLINCGLYLTCAVRRGRGKFEFHVPQPIEASRINVIA